MPKGEQKGGGGARYKVDEVTLPLMSWLQRGSSTKTNQQYKRQGSKTRERASVMIGVQESNFLEEVAFSLVLKDDIYFCLTTLQLTQNQD